MTNNTLHKYLNLYSCNRTYNDAFNKWLQERYTITIPDTMWSYGAEIIRDKITGQLQTDARVMQIYVKERRPYFKWFDEAHDYFASGYKTIEEWWQSKKSR